MSRQNRAFGTGEKPSCIFCPRRPSYPEARVVRAASDLQGEGDMAEESSEIRQARQLVVNVGDTAPAETESQDSSNGEGEQAAAKAPETDPLPGERDWAVKWFGPFFDSVLPENRRAGLYLLYVGNYPLLVSSSANVYIALTRHLVFNSSQIVPVDVLGREILHYASLYKQRLSLKTGLLFENKRLIHPRDYLYCYRRAAAAIAYTHVIPCNQYSRLHYDYDPLTLTNFGKFFPLKEKFHVDAQTKPVRTPMG